MASTTPIPGMTRQHLARRFLLGLLGLVGLALVVLAMLPYLVSLDSVKGQIVARIEAVLQRQVDVGAVRLQLLSGLGVVLEEVIIYNPPGWQQPYFINVDRLAVDVAWRPLLRRQVEITSLRLRDGRIIIERDVQGHLSLTPLAASTSQPAQSPATPVQRSTSGDRPQPGAHPLAALVISEMTLHNMQLTFVDRRVIPGQEVITALSNVHLTLHDVALGTPIPLDMLATLSPDGGQNIRLRGHVGPILERLAVESVPIDVRFQPTQVHLDQFTPYLGANFLLVQGHVGGDMTVQGSLGQSLRINGTLSLVDAMLREGIVPEASRALPKLTSTQDITVDLHTGQAELTSVEINAASLQATITGLVQQLATTPRLDLRVATKTFTPSELLVQFPMLASMLPTPMALQGNAQLRATFTGTARDFRSEAQIDLSETALRTGAFSEGAQGGDGVLLETDQASVHLLAQVHHADPLHVSLDVRARRLMFDHHVTDKPEPAPVPAPTHAPQPEPTPRIAPPQPRPPALRLSGKASIAEGRLKRLDFQHMTAEFNLINGLLKTTQQMNLYGGSSRGTMQVDFTTSEPSYTLAARLAGLDIGQAINTLTPAKDVLMGVLDTDMHLSGRGFTWDRLNKTLSGNGHVKISEAQLTTFDLIPKLVQLLSHVGEVVGGTLPSAWQHESFRAIEGDWRLHQGKLLTDDLRLRGEGLEALLKGYIGLDQSIDYAGTLFLPVKFLGLRHTPMFLRQGEAGRVAVPFTVQGMVTAPRIAVHEKALVGLVQEELADTVSKQLGIKLEELFGKPPASDQRGQESDQTGQEAEGRPQRQTLPEKLLRELLRR